MKLANFKIAAIVALLLLMFGIVGHFDAEDEEAPATVEAFEEEAVEETDVKGGDNVVTLDAFRRK